ncbi:hypothetical protein KIPB_006951 [Kipferlia bialata]|uniref:Uncharacterized protein n=1 Tax=Kipferlia bialata TaxID=797122 RepID=A0A9K3CXT1_9EUKA|nr:hypothetical protein KIPB_006951 [Kipferlia bialata]|eukprot:g6951.t1
MDLVLLEENFTWEWCSPLYHLFALVDRQAYCEGYVARVGAHQPAAGITHATFQTLFTDMPDTYPPEDSGKTKFVENLSTVRSIVRKNIAAANAAKQ